MKKNRVAKYRLLLSKILLVFFISILVVSEHGDITSQGTSIFLDLLGFTLILIGGFGRLWSSLYIEGSKNRKLISGGPYSIMRNPLYIFSLALLVGYCCAIQSIIITIVFLFIFTLLYMSTIYNEEKILLTRHNDVYLDYFKKTPRFLPKFKLYKGSQKDSMIDVNMPKIESVLIEIAGFIFFFGLIKILDFLHQAGYIKTHFTLY